MATLCLSTRLSVCHLLACPRPPTRAQLASGGEDGGLLLWSLPECTRIAALQHPHEVASVAFHPDGGSYLAW